MKKVILLLLLILPVIIVAVSFAIAGFVGRAQRYIVIENVYVTDLDDFFEYKENGKIVYWYNQDNVNDRFDLLAEVDGVYEFEKFITVSPSRANFSGLDFVISNPSAVKIEDGKIHVMQNLRSTDGLSVEIRIEYGEKLFMIIYVKPEIDNDRFDYFGFDYNMLDRGIKEQNLEYINVTADRKIEITRAGTASLGYIIPLGEILNDGFNIAPANLLGSYEGKNDFLDSIEIKSGDNGVLKIFEVNRKGWKDFDAEILDICPDGVKITVTSDYLGGGLTFEIILIVL